MGEHPEMGHVRIARRRTWYQGHERSQLTATKHCTCLGQFTGSVTLDSGLFPPMVYSRGCHSHVSCLLVYSREDQYKVLVPSILSLPRVSTTIANSSVLTPPQKSCAIEPFGLDEFESSESPCCEKRIDCIYLELELPSVEGIVVG